MKFLTVYFCDFLFLFCLIWNTKKHFTLSKVFFSKFYTADYGNSVIYLVINIALLTTLHVIWTIKKVQNDVVHIENNTNKRNIMVERIIQNVTEVNQGVKKPIASIFSAFSAFSWFVGDGMSLIRNKTSQILLCQITKYQSDNVPNLYDT